MESRGEKGSEEREHLLLTFLRRTKEGKYAQVDREALPNDRAREEADESYSEEEYYYGVSTRNG